MKLKIVEYKGKKYALVSDNKERECSRCALRDKCYEKPWAICQEELGLTYEETIKHRLEALEYESVTGQKVRRISGAHQGGMMWVFYYLKMGVIAAAVTYIAYSFLRLL